VSVKSFPEKRDTVVPSQQERNELRRAKFFDATLTLIERGKAGRFDNLKKASTDHRVTGLSDRKGFETLGRNEFIRSRRYERPLCMVVIAVDGFEAINDRFGEPASDRVLRNIAALCRTNKRDCDLAVHLGSQEFAVLMPETALDGGRLFAERLRKVFRRTFETKQMALTISIGIAETTAQTLHFAELIQRAEQALYEAVRAGGNLVVSSQV
jgi:diguanylate cyclase (GGDEF)-like protein